MQFEKKVDDCLAGGFDSRGPRSSQEMNHALFQTMPFVVDPVLPA